MASGGGAQEASRIQRIREGLAELTVEFVGEGVLQLLSCLLLAGVGAGLWWLGHHSLVLAIGVGVLLLAGIVAVVVAWRRPRPGRAKRIYTRALVAVTLIALWFVFYGLGCGCL